MSKMSGGSTAVVNTANTAPLDGMAKPLGSGPVSTQNLKVAQESKPLGSGPVSTQNLKVAQESKPLGSGPVVPVLTEKWILPDKTVGDAPFELVTPKSNSNGKISYTNGNDEVATVTPDGHVEIKNAGTTTIVAHQEADGVYGKAEFKIPLLVFQADPTIDPWVLPDKTVGDAPFELVPPKSNSDGKISYTGDNAEVATVPPDGSAVVIKGAGTTTIVAHQEATDNYSEGTMEGKLTVAAADPNEVAAIQVQDAPQGASQDAPQDAPPQGESRVNENAIYDDGTRVPIGERCEFVRIDPKKHEFITSHKGPFESGKLLKNSSWLTGDGDDRFFYPDCEVQLDNGEIVKSDFNSMSDVMMPKLLFKVMPKPIYDVFAAPAPVIAAVIAAPAPVIAAPAPVIAAPAPVIAAPAPVIAHQPEEPEAKRRKCSEEATFLNAVPSDCIQPGPQPQLHQLVEAAIQLPASMAAKAGAEGVSDALIATGNEALIEIATAQALGPEQAKQLEIMSDDPKVAAALGNVKANISHAVENSIDTLGREIQKPVEEAATKLTTGAITAGTSALASVTGPLVPLATLAETVGELVKDATQISDAVGNATGEVRNAMAQTTELTKALDEAQKNAAAAAASGVAGATNAATSGVAEVNDAATSGVAEVNNAIPKGPKTEIGKKRGREGGGSRKRRRIHKLSRRIERTLRRVQKKHGLRDDKNSFLRRTLRRGYVKP